MSTIFYVYIYEDPTKENEPFYVGKGQGWRYKDHILEAMRWDGLSSKNRHKLYRIRKIWNNNMNVIIRKIFHTYNEEDAFTVEKLLINMLGRRDLGTGTLLNLTDGGEGVRNKIFSAEERKARSDRTAGKNNPMYGKNHKKEHCDKISKTRKDKIRKGLIIPSKHSAKWREELRKNNAGGKATSIHIYQYDLNGNFIKKWPSANSVYRESGIGRGRIRSAVKNKWQTPDGFFWREELEVVDATFWLNEQKENQSPIRNFRKILQYTLDGEFIKEWVSLSEASRNIGVSIDLLSQIYCGIRKPDLGGFIWKKA